LATRALPAEIQKLRGVSTKHRVLLGRRQERAVLADIVDALPIGAEAFDVGMSEPHAAVDATAPQEGIEEASFAIGAKKAKSP